MPFSFPHRSGQISTSVVISTLSLAMRHYEEPPHVHVVRDDCTAKYWLEPLRLDWAKGFRPVEMRRIQAMIAVNREHILEAWNEYFGQ